MSKNQETIKNKKGLKSVEQYRVEIQAEINENKVSIDRDAFKKSQGDRDLLKSLRNHHKRELKAAGYDHRKTMNIPGKDFK